MHIYIYISASSIPSYLTSIPIPKKKKKMKDREINNKIIFISSIINHITMHARWINIYQVEKIKKYIDFILESARKVRHLGSCLSQGQANLVHAKI